MEFIAKYIRVGQKVANFTHWNPTHFPVFFGVGSIFFLIQYWADQTLIFKLRRHYVSISLSLSPYSTSHSLIPVLCIGIRRPLRCTCPHMPTTVVRSTIRARCHTPPLIQRCHHVWHTTGVSDGGCKPARHMWMVLWLTVPYRHCQLPEQCGVTLVISDSTMTDCPNHRLWHIMVQCHRPPMSHHTSMSTHSLPYIGMSSDWPQKPREEDMPQTLVTTSQTPVAWNLPVVDWSN